MKTFKVLVRQTRDGWINVQAETGDEARTAVEEFRTRDITWDDDCQELDVMEAEEVTDE